MDAAKLEKGDIVQVSPRFDEATKGCLMIVVECHSWGIIGAMVNLGDNVIGKHSHMRVAWPFLEPTGGRARWDWEGKEIVAPEPKLRHHP